MLEDYLRHVARTGDSVFPWPKVRPLLKRKLDLIADQYCQLCPPEKIPAMPNVDPFKYEQLRTEIHFRIDSLNGSVVSAHHGWGGETRLSFGVHNDVAADLLNY